MTGKQDPSPTMMEEGQEGCGGRTEKRIPTSGVVWKEAPESAIHSVQTGGGLVPPPRPGRLLAGWSGRCPERREQGSSSGEHGRRLGPRTRARDGLDRRGGRDSLRSGERGSGPRGVPGRVRGGRDGLRGVRGGEGGGGPRGLCGLRGGRDGGHKGGGGQVCGRGGLRGVRGGEGGSGAAAVGAAAAAAGAARMRVGATAATRSRSQARAAARTRS